MQLDDTPCLLWLGPLNRHGYGRIGRRLVHNLVWCHVFGPRPKGMDVDHLCRNHACYRLSHLELVTHRENVLRGNGPTAINARKTGCLRGHGPYPEGKRRCQVCTRISHRRDRDPDPRPKPRGAPRGERHPQVWLTDAQVAEMRALRAAGWTCQRIADRFGVGDYRTVWQIVEGRRRA
jgi:hypothetical protein